MSAEPSARFALPAHIAETGGYLLLRLWLGLRALVAGLEKYAGTRVVEEPLLDEFGEPDINGTMIALKTKVYDTEHYHGLPPPLADRLAAEPLLPGWILGIYEAILGPALLALGIALLIGLAPRITLLLHGLLYCSLSIGLILLNESGGVAWLAIHVLAVVTALKLVHHDRFGVLPRW